MSVGGPPLPPGLLLTPLSYEGPAQVFVLDEPAARRALQVRIAAGSSRKRVEKLTSVTHPMKGDVMGRVTGQSRSGDACMGQGRQL